MSEQINPSSDLGPSKHPLVTYGLRWRDGWDSFWFQTADPATLCLIRLLMGAMLVYTHAVWTLELPAFFSAEGVFQLEFMDAYHGGSPFAWSHFYWSSSVYWLWGSHAISMFVLIAFTVGFKTRWTSILSYLIVVSYAHRASGALYGLDQVNGFVTLYLALGPSGALYSVDHWLQRRAGQGRAPSVLQPSVLANVAIRLMQVHLCVMYFFAGVGKLLGAAWWDGTALWGAFASYDYQTVDMTFLAHWPHVVNLMTHVALFWEVSYAFGVWPRLTRPIYVLMAIPVHLGIGLCMGMQTFGLAMIFANLCFLSPSGARWILRRFPGGASITKPPALATESKAEKR